MAGDSPLYAAAFHGLVDVTRVLLEGGAATSVPGSKANVFKYASGEVLEVIEKYKRR
jgi:hypothetical protein